MSCKSTVELEPLNEASIPRHTHVRSAPTGRLPNGGPLSRERRSRPLELPGAPAPLVGCSGLLGGRRLGPRHHLARGATLAPTARTAVNDQQTAAAQVPTRSRLPVHSAASASPRRRTVRGGVAEPHVLVHPALPKSVVEPTSNPSPTKGTLRPSTTRSPPRGAPARGSAAPEYRLGVHRPAVLQPNSGLSTLRIS